MYRKSSFAACVAVLGLVSATSAHAQNSLSGGASYVAETSAKPSCRPAVLHILREGTALSGVVFFKDGSGVSSVQGTTDGKTFQWTMASMTGAGPQGEVTGDISPQGALRAKLTGTNCTLETTVPQYHEYSNG